MRFDGVALVELSPAQMKAQRRGLQMVFQDPFASLNPRMHVGQIIEEGMAALGVGADGAGRRQAIAALLERVGLSADMAQRYPHAFSGGQRQRVAIARALAVSPKLLVCDEPTSALDVSVQAQILNLLRELQRELGLAYLFITHNLAVVDYLADDVAVMYLGRIVESGPADAVLGRTAHPYTRALLDAVPRIEAPPSDGGSIGGELPSPIRPPAGCHFHPRCPYAEPRCRTTYPDVRELAPGHRVRCHFPLG